MREEAASWPQTWAAEVLARPPLIAPSRQFTYPLQIAGEEDALSRGALRLIVRPRAGGSFLATCALGFVDGRLPTGVFACPNPDEMCVVAGGYAYVVDTTNPERSTHIPLKPVVEIRCLVSHGRLLFVGFHRLVAWGHEGYAWETGRLSWEGIQLGKVEGVMVLGTGWDLRTDKEVPFSIDLDTGRHKGGPFTTLERSGKT